MFADLCWFAFMYFEKMFLPFFQSFLDYQPLANVIVFHICDSNKIKSKNHISTILIKNVLE